MIRFKRVSWKNFLSTGNQPIEIFLDHRPTTLIVGHNGSGKSTILDALTFGLFGKPFRKIHKPQLCNTINQRDCRVEVDFTIGTKEYKIVRAIKPNLFEIYCNGIKLNQDPKARDYQKDLEQQILKLNFRSFSQIVILGSSSFVPFMQLSPNHRREVIEDLLDIQIFSVMNGLLKEKFAKLRDDIQETEYQTKLLGEQITMQTQYVKTIKADLETKLIENKDTIGQNQNMITVHQKEITHLKTEIAELLTKAKSYEKWKDRQEQLREIEMKMKSNMKRNQKQLSFLYETEVCGMCEQSIDEKFKEKMTEKRMSKIHELSNGLTVLGRKLDTVFDHLTELDAITTTIQERQSKVIEKQTSMQACTEYIKKVEQEIYDLEHRHETGDVKKVEELTQEKVMVDVKAEELKDDRHYHDIAKAVLEDRGIKTKIIRQYLPVMNKLINKYLSSMDFFVNFTLDENFTETIKSRFRDEFSYASFSEGEKMRIDLSLLFTWRAIAKLKNSANTNLLILDEVFDSSLDVAGTDDFLKLLQSFGKDTNIFVISHKGDVLFDKFHTVLKFDKVKNFTQLSFLGLGDVKGGYSEPMKDGMLNV